MEIDAALCIACEACIPYCPVGAIGIEDDHAVIDLEECVECSNCLRADVCPEDAVYQQELVWPRSIRSILSNVLTVSKESDITGRGTEEMKTNDVTGRFRRGWAGIGIELGRPTLGARFYDVEKVARAVAGLGVSFESANPVTGLMADPAAGTFRKDVLNEKVLSAIIEFAIETERIPALIDILKTVAADIDTVFSLDVSARCEPDGSVPVVNVLEKCSVPVSINGKTNLGLGRPPAGEA